MNFICKCFDSNTTTSAVLQPVCSKCEFIVNTHFISNEAKTHLISSLNPTEFFPKKISQDNNLFLNLTKQCVYSHLNVDILYDAPSGLYSDKNILLIGSGSVKRQSVLQSLKLLSFKRLVCLSNSKNWACHYFDDWILAESEDISKKEATLQAVKDYIRKENIKFDAIFTYDDYCVLIASYLQQNFGLPGMNFDFVQKIKNKYEFRHLSMELDINCPKFFLISSSERKQFLFKLDENVHDSNVMSLDGSASCTFRLL